MRPIKDGRQLFVPTVSVFLLILIGSAHAVEPTAECHGEQSTDVGTSGDDVIRGTSGRDVIVAMEGDDLIKSLDGSDTICGGKGNDRVRGGPDSDSIYAGDGGDHVHGGRGFNDSIYAGSGNDLVHGGPGRNLLVAGPGRDLMFGSSHYDNFESVGADWDDPDKDLFVGRGRRDSFSTDPGKDTFRGGRGRDWISFYDSPTGIELDLGAGTSTGDGEDSLVSIRDAFGSRHNDTIRGTDEGNEIGASSGNDSVYGLGGEDDIYDSGGRDYLDGGSGADLISSTGCVSGEGGPSICQQDPPLSDTLLGGPGDDTVGSGPGDDEVWGNLGNDLLLAGDGSDAVFGGRGNDKLHGGKAAGSRPNRDDGKLDELDGGDGVDVCEGEDDSFTNCEL